VRKKTRNKEDDEVITANEDEANEEDDNSEINVFT